MAPALRVFGGTLEQLWNDRGLVNASSGERLALPDIAGLLRLGPVHFVVADPGLPLHWIDLARCYRFWKDEVKPHLVHPDAKVRLEDMPGEYFYAAQQWLSADTSAPIVVLFRHHQIAAGTMRWLRRLSEPLRSPPVDSTGSPA